MNNTVPFFSAMARPSILREHGSTNMGPQTWIRMKESRCTRLGESRDDLLLIVTIGIFWKWGTLKQCQS